MVVKKFTRGVWVLLAFILFNILPSADALEIKGAVRDADKSPAKATVWLVEEQSVKQIQTPASGEYAFTNLEVGPYQLIALDESGQRIGGHTGFIVGDVNMDLLLMKAAPLRIRILDPKYAPQPGARITTLWINGYIKVPVEQLTDHGFPALRTDDKGLLTIPYAPENGGVGIVAEHIQHGRAIIDYIPVRGEQEEIVLPEGLTLRGRVRYEDAPVANAYVFAYIPGTNSQKSFAEATTDADGVYRLNVPKGVYQIGVRHSDYASPPPKNQTMLDDAKAPCDFDLIQPRYIHGRVVYSKNKPCAGAFIRYQLGNTIYEEYFTDLQGRFTLRVPSEEGALYIQPPAGFMTVNLPVIEVGTGAWTETTLNDIEMTELPRLEGVVLDVDKKPLANALITSQNLIHPLYLLSDEKGAFGAHIQQVLVDDKLNFMVEHPERMQRKDFTLNVRRPKPIEVQLKNYRPDTTNMEDGFGGNSLTDLVGEPALAWDCSQWFNSEALTLDGLKGKVIVLCFWASFDQSTHGMSYINELKALHHIFGDAEDIIFIGIHDATSTPIEVEDGIEALGIQFPVGLDKDPFVSFEKYGINIIPQTILIDKAGMVRYVHPEGRLHELIKVLRSR